MIGERSPATGNPDAGRQPRRDRGPCGRSPRGWTTVAARGEGQAGHAADCSGWYAD